MKDHTGCIRGFHQYSRSWYARFKKVGSEFVMADERDMLDQVMFGMYSPEGGSSGEMSVCFVDVGGEYMPQLRAYDGSWSALASFSDLIARMGELDGKDITPRQFCELLVECGFKDMTKEVQS